MNLLKSKKAVKPRKPSKAKRPDVFRVITDETGNILTLKNNGTRIVLSLKLLSESKSRRIGIINLAQKVFEVKRDRARHLFRNTQSYGFNYKIIEEAKLFDKVRLKDDLCEWLIPKSFIKDNGHFLHFKANGGFEKQKFIPLDILDEFKKEPKI